jgi:hypothetical protein
VARRASRTNAVLVLAALTLAVAWFALPRSRPANHRVAADWSDILESAPSGIVVRRGTEHIVLTRQPNSTSTERYVVANQSMVTIDPSAVDRLILALSRLDVLRPVSTPEDSLRLGPPTIEIELDTASGKRRVSLFGVAPGPEGARYSVMARNAQRLVVVVAPASAEALDIEPSSLLDHRVLGWVPSELRRIELSSAAGPITLERQDSGRWLVAQASRARARRSTIEGLLLALTELSLTRLLESSVAASSLGAGPLLEISLHAKRRDRLTIARLKLGGRCPARNDELALTLAGERPMAGCVAASAIEKLALDRAALVDDAAFSLHGDEVERLEVKGLGPTWTLQRDEAGFRLGPAEPSAVSLSAGNGLLNSLVSVRGRVSEPCDFAARHAEPLLSLRSFVVGDGDGASSEAIHVGKVAADASRRICRDDGIELVVQPRDAEWLELDSTSLRDMTLIEVPPETITEMRIETASEHQLLRTDGHRGINLIEPRLGVLGDAAAIETLREQLSHLHATRWLPRTVARTAVSRSPNASVDFLVSNALPNDLAREPTPTTGMFAGDAGAVAAREIQNQPTVVHHRLHLLLDDSGHSVGWLDGDPDPFEVADALSELVDGLLLDRSLLRLNAADRVISLALGPNQIRLERRQDQWLLDRPEPGRVAPAPLIAALENLRAISIHAGLPRPVGHKARASGPTLRIEYAADRKALAHPRLRFEIGVRVRRRGQWVRNATLQEPRLTLAFRDQDLQAILGMFGQSPPSQ